MKGRILRMKKYEDALGSHLVLRTPGDDAKMEERFLHVEEDGEAPLEAAEQRRPQEDATPSKTSQIQPQHLQPLKTHLMVATQPPATALGGEGPDLAPHLAAAPWLGDDGAGVELLLAWQVVDVTTVHQ